MLTAEIPFALLFYAVFSLSGLIGLPLLLRIVPSRPLAIGASKIAGLVLFAYGVWLGASLHLLDYQNRWLVRGAFCALVVLGAVALRKSMPRLKDVLWIEGVSLVLYLAYLLLRSRHPAAEGTEHFMDMALLAASSKTSFFPFVDPWYAGKTINYYYYGSYAMSVIGNLSGVPYALSYNLALGLIYSQSAMLSGLLAFALTGLKRAGVLAAFLATTAGTLFYAQCAVRGAMTTPPTICSYASSTRLYTPSYIINEIPSYSFTVGNLHAHLLALPFFLFALGLLYSAARDRKPRFPVFLLLAFSLATSGMTNSWDAITLMSLAGVLVLLKARTGLSWLAYGAGTVAAVVLLTSPAWRAFDSPVLGLGFTPSYVRLHGLSNVQYPTPIPALAGMWGIYAIAVLLIFAAARKELSSFPLALAIVSAGILAGVELFFVRDIYSVANPPYFRANTTFKFGYHAWVMLSIVFAACAGLAMTSIRRTALTWTMSALVFIAVVAGAVYPVEAIRQYYLAATTPSTLDGSAWMKSSAGDWDTVGYIDAAVPERRVIAEAVGDSYTTHSRITTFTGMITPMGWTSHEWTWRFRTRAAANAPPQPPGTMSWAQVSVTAQSVARLYTTRDSAEAKRLIDYFGIDYVYVGALERQAYPTLDEKKFYALGTLVFESHDSRLFAVSNR